MSIETVKECAWKATVAGCYGAILYLMVNFVEIFDKNFRKNNLSKKIKCQQKNFAFEQQ